MAFSTQYIYERVSDLIQKQQAGYMPSSSFNRDIEAANLVLFEYYFVQYELTKKIANAMTPFLVEISINNTAATNFSSIFDYPANLFHETELKYEKTLNKDCGNEVSIVPVDYLQDNEEAYTLSSPIRKPNLDKNIIRWNRKNNVIHVYPKEVKSIYIKYLKKPQTPFYGTTININANQDIEVYIPPNPLNPLASIDFEWDLQEAENIVDLILLYQGMQLRETAIIQFAKAKQKNVLVN
jgi:hypothetical protein